MGLKEETINPVFDEISHILLYLFSGKYILSKVLSIDRPRICQTVCWESLVRFFDLVEQKKCVKKRKYQLLDQNTLPWRNIRNPPKKIVHYSHHDVNSTEGKKWRLK